MQTKKMRILVTGGCGFIASHLVNLLVEKYPDYKIINLDKLDVCSSLKNCEKSQQKPNYKFVKGNICSPDLVNYVLKTENIDTIIHAAAQSHVDSSFGNSLSFTQNNIVGTHVLLESAYAIGIKRFLHISTDEVYGNCDGERKTESSSTNPTNPYSASKAAAESLVQGYINSFDFPAIISRGNNVYGPYQYTEKLIGKMTSRLKMNRPCCIHGDGSNKRHFLHVEDAVSAIDIILHHGKVGEIYNMGSKDEFTNIDLVKKIINIMKPGEDPQNWIEFVKDRPFNDVRYYLTYDKLSALGWVQKKDFNTGLLETIDWYKSISPEKYWSPESLLSLEAHPKQSLPVSYSFEKL